jgi:endoglucanase
MALVTTAEIQAQWLDRVKQVVQYCIDDSLYVILNIPQ